jgi:hypothetical protein
MASVSQLNPYHCDQCGTANIVAQPILYQRGTHTYSTRFHSGTTQSFSAQPVTPPRPRGYLRPFLVWGPALAFFSLWTLIGFDSILELRRITTFKAELAFVFLALCVTSLAGWSSIFAKSRATTVRFIPDFTGTGNTPIYVGVADGSA